jgi:hypothetical protein
MKGLAQLNTFSQTSLDVVDLRPARAVFDLTFPLTPKDIILDVGVGLTYTVTPNVNITEIINYQTANVRYIVKPFLYSSEITWDDLPEHLTLTVASNGSSYTISGFKDESDWQAVKSFVLTLPSNYTNSPFWNLEVSVVYYNEIIEEDTVLNWEAYDPDYYWISRMTSSFSIAATGSKVKLLESALTASTSLTSTALRRRASSASVSSQFNLSAEASKLDSLMSSTFAFNSSAVIIGRGVSNVNSSASVSSSAVTVKGVNNVTGITRTYVSNNSTLIFETNTPFIADFDEPDTTYEIILNSNRGQFGTTLDPDLIITELSFSGTKAEVNAFLPTVKFYPTKDESRNGTYGYEQWKNGVKVYDSLITLNFAGAGNLAPLEYNYTTSGTYNITVPIEYVRYSSVDYIAGAAGGGGGVSRSYNNPTPSFGGGFGSGGGAGFVSSATDTSLFSRNLSIVIGEGGLKGLETDPDPNNSDDLASGYQGEDTVITGLTSSTLTLGGGYGGRGPGNFVTLDAGNTGSPSTFVRGTYGYEQQSSSTERNFFIGAGGGGAAGNGASVNFPLDTVIRTSGSGEPQGRNIAGGAGVTHSLIPGIEAGKGGSGSTQTTITPVYGGGGNGGVSFATATNGADGFFVIRMYV